MTAFRIERRAAGIVPAVLWAMLSAVLAPSAGTLAQTSPPTGPVPLTPQSPAPPSSQPPNQPAPAQPPAQAPAQAAMPAAEPVQVQELANVDPNAVGVLDEAHGGFSGGMWTGTAVTVVEKALPLLPAPVSWRSLRQLERRLLLTAAQVPAGKPGGEALIKLRADKLWALGDVDGLDQLLKSVPTPAMTVGLRRMLAEVALAAGDAAACDQVAPLRTLMANDPYPAKLQVFCLFAAGKAAEAELEIDLLHEQKVVDPAFFAAADALSGSGTGRLDGVTQPTALVLAMARAAKLILPEATITAPQPAALQRALIQMPNAAPDARLLAAERAEAAGAVETDLLRQLYESVVATPQELNSLPPDASKTPRGRAILYKAALQQPLPATRADLMARALAGEPASFAATARLYAPLLASLPVTPELTGFAPWAARALLAAQRFDAARPWLGLLRAEALAGDATAISALAVLTPLARLAGIGEPLSLSALAAWHRARGELAAGDAVVRRATLLIALLSALGDRLPAEEWLPLLDGPAVVTARQARPALWLGLTLAAEDGHVGETVMLSLATLPDAAQAEPLEFYRVVAALRRVGLDADARALAVEAAIANGL